MGVRVLLLSIGLLIGYYAGKSKPITVKHQHSVNEVQVRDQDWKRCSKETITLRNDSVVEDLWNCPHVKVFLVRKLH